MLALGVYLALMSSLMCFACSSKSTRSAVEVEPDGSAGSDGGSSSGGSSGSGGGGGGSDATATGGSGGTAGGGAGGTAAIDSGASGGASGLGGSGGTATPDAATQDAAADAAPLIRPPCANPVLFDDFDDGVMNTSLWTAYGDSSATYEETGGHLVITLSNASGDHYAGYYSASSFDLTGRAVAIGIVEVPNINAATANGVAIDFGTTYGANIETHDSTVRFMFRDGPNYTILTTMAFDANVHRGYRFREAAGVLYWETWDGSSWQTRTQRPLGTISVSETYFVTSTGTYQNSLQPGRARFDNFCLGPP